jgi:hypothetical protein
VIAPGWEQLALAFGWLRTEVPDAADDQPGADAPPGLDANAVYGSSAISASDAHRLARSCQIAGYRIVVHAESGMAAITAPACGFIEIVTGKNAPARRTAPDHATRGYRRGKAVSRKRLVLRARGVPDRAVIGGDSRSFTGTPQRG